MVTRILFLMLLALPAFAQEFTFLEQAWMGKVATPSAQNPFPSDISGSLICYDVNALGLSDGSTISSLTDSVSAYHALNADPGTTNKPYWTNNVSYLNNEGWLDFDGVDDYLQTNFTSGASQPVTYFMVARLKTVSNGKFFFDRGENGGARNALLVSGSSSPFALSCYSGTTAGPAGTILAGKWYVFQVVFNTTNSFISTNDVSLGTFNPGTEGMAGMTLAARYSRTLFGSMDLAYLRVYSASLSTSNATRVVTYLKTRYGL